MKISVYLKFILGYLAFGIAAFAVIATLSTSLTHSYLIESRRDTLYDEAALVANSCSEVYSGENIPISAANPQIQAIATFLNADVWIVDKQGVVLADSSNERVGSIITAFDPTASGNKSYMVGNYFDAFPYEVLSVQAPITGKQKVYGYVLIHLPMDMVLDSQNQILNIVYITYLIFFALSLSLLAVFHIVVYSPLRKIEEAARQYAGGNLNYRISVDSRDEMGYLADTLNYMSSELNKAEDNQKDFVANVSHDFRSPLTSIKGYLEAILDGTIPQELHEKYIKIVIGETERLTKLTKSLLELNTTDAKARLKRTNFDINRVIRDTASSFEGQCTEKRITLELTFEDDTQMVYGDSSKIQQVLYNLIDNAIKFSRNDSSIYISTSQKKDKVYISVRDTGVGIAKKDIGKIFDRFYKSDSSRGKDKRGTGLGLAIVKEIIQQHGENIDVISTEGVGTEFVFSLPSEQELKD